MPDAGRGKKYRYVRSAYGESCGRVRHRWLQSPDYPSAGIRSPAEECRFCAVRFSERQGRVIVGVSGKTLLPGFQARKERPEARSPEALH